MNIWQGLSWIGLFLFKSDGNMAKLKLATMFWLESDQVIFFINSISACFRMLGSSHSLFYCCWSCLGAYQTQRFQLFFKESYIFFCFSIGICPNKQLELPIR